MPPKTKQLTATVLLIVVLLAAACQPVLTPPEPSSSAGPEPVTITLAYNRFLQTSFGPGPAPIEVIQQEVARRYPHIEVQLNLMPDTVNGMHDALAVWITAEDPTVDIYGMDTPWVLEFGKAGWAVPLNELIPELADNYVSSGLDVFSYEGQRLGVPFWGSISGLFYRQDLLNQYGFDPPGSYDDLVAIAETITADQPELTGFLWPGAKEESLVMVWAEFLLGFGGRYFDDGGRCAMNEAEGVQALEFMVDLIETGVSPREVTAWQAEEARTRFVEGQALFLRHNHDIVTWLDDPERSAIGGQWGLTVNPAQPGGQPTGVTGGFAFAINPHTDNLEEAAQVLQVIASQPVQKGFAIAWGPVQYYQGLYEDPEVAAANANAATIQPLLDTATPRPPSTSYAELSNILQEEIHAALTGIKSAPEALDSACTRIDAIG